MPDKHHALEAEKDRPRPGVARKPLLDCVEFAFHQSPAIFAQEESRCSELLKDELGCALGRLERRCRAKPSATTTS